MQARHVTACPLSRSLLRQQQRACPPARLPAANASRMQPAVLLPPPAPRSRFLRGVQPPEGSSLFAATRRCTCGRTQTLQRCCHDAATAFMAAAVLARMHSPVSRTHMPRARPLPRHNPARTVFFHIIQPRAPCPRTAMTGRRHGGCPRQTFREGGQGARGKGGQPLYKGVPPFPLKHLPAVPLCGCIQKQPAS